MMGNQKWLVSFTTLGFKNTQRKINLNISVYTVLPTILLKLLISVFSQVPKFNVTPHPWLQVLQNSIKPFVWGRGLVVVDVPCITDDPTNILHSPSTQTFHILKIFPENLTLILQLSTILFRYRTDRIEISHQFG